MSDIYVLNLVWFFDPALIQLIGALPYLRYPKLPMWIATEAANPNWDRQSPS